ncbi:MAG: Gfo/Idh/MocA family oxidoreductase [Oscillibacter sp.]|nr:Gfo/Idh/MocA family oxidoreductase [Oscillibacter sp.]
MRLGILGTGMIVQELLPLLGEIGFDAVSILGTQRSRERTEELSARYQLEHCWYDYGDLLASDVDAVYIGLPNFLHFSHARRALEAGKDVIVEKPAVTTLAEFRELRRLAKEKGRILLEAVTVHYLPAYRALKEELSSVGPVRVVSMNYSQYSSRYDAFLEGETLPAFDPAKAGGALMDINVYNLHFTVGLFGKPEAVRYFATVQRGIDTSGMMVLDYGGFKAVCIGAKDCQAPVRSTIQGEKGCMVVPMPANQMRAYSLAPNRQEAVERAFPEEHRMLPEFRTFRRILAERDFETASAMLDIGETVAEILEEGRRQAGIVFPGDQ